MVNRKDCSPSRKTESGTSKRWAVPRCAISEPAPDRRAATNRRVKKVHKVFHGQRFVQKTFSWIGRLLELTFARSASSLTAGGILRSDGFARATRGSDRRIVPLSVGLSRLPNGNRLGAPRTWSRPPEARRFPALTRSQPGNSRGGALQLWRNVSEPTASGFVACALKGKLW